MPENVFMNDQHSSDWSFTKAEINSSRAIQPLDVRSVITDFEVFEHLDKPYLTGKMVMLDGQRVYERFDFQGGEELSITIQRTLTGGDLKPIEKVFIIDQVLDVARTNEQNSVLHFHLIEKCGFSDTLQNVNKSYTGQPQQIIEDVSKEFLKKDVINNTEENVQNSIKVLVPNLSPIETMAWIKNRATTSEGYPFFLFSTFALDQLFLYDLGSMLSAQPINISYPYTFSPSTSATESGVRLTKIHKFKLSNVENLSAIINAGYVGASHSFYDVTTMTKQKIKFDVHLDLLNNVKEKIDKEQSAVGISPLLKYEDTILSDYESRNFTNIYASKNFEDKKSLTEEKQEGSHRRKIISNAMKTLLTKSPLEITIDAREFLNGQANYCIGNKITCKFIPTRDPDGQSLIDKKLSGDYLIVAARHVFNAEGCFSNLIVSKIANRNMEHSYDEAGTR